MWHDARLVEYLPRVFGGRPGEGWPLPEGLHAADANTWERWASASRAMLWEYAALALGLEPEGMDWRVLVGRQDERTKAGAFAAVLHLATMYVEHFELRCETIEPELPMSIVGHWQFVAWCDHKRICLLLPNDFPDGDPAQRPSVVRAPVPLRVEVPPKPVRRAKEAKHASEIPPGFLRIKGLAEAVVPMSEATIWRMVKAGTFPAPIKFSQGVTAWSRESIDQWNRESAAAAEAKLAAAKKRAAGRAVR